MTRKAYDAVRASPVTNQQGEASTAGPGYSNVCRGIEHA